MSGTDERRAAQTDPEGLSVRGRLAFLAKDSLLYGGAAAFSRCFALITFPILTRYFGVADYGIIDLFGVFAATAAIILTFGQDSATARFFYDSKETEHRRQVVSQSFAFVLILLAVVTPILFLSAGMIARFVEHVPDSRRLIELVALTVPCIVVHGLTTNICKWSFARRRFLTLTVGEMLVRVCVLIVAIYVFEIDVVGVFYINLGLGIFFSIVGLIFIQAWLAIPRGLGILGEMIPYAIPLWIVSMATAIVPAYERSLVERLLGTEELGLYAAGAKVALLIVIPIMAFQTAWGPFSLSIHKGDEVGRTYDLVFRVFALCVMILALALGIFASPILDLLAGSGFVKGAEIVFPLAAGLAFMGMGWIVGVGISIRKKPVLRLVAYLIYLPITGVAIYVLAGRFGTYGVAMGVMIGQASLAVLESWLSYRVMPVEWSFRPVVLSCVLVVVVGILLQNFGPTESTLLMLVIGIVVVPIAGFLGWRLLLGRHERAAVLDATRSRLRSLLGR